MSSPARGHAYPLLLLGILGLLTACRTENPATEVEVTDVETYWVVDPTVGDTHYLAAAVRLRLRNRGRKTQRTIQANAVFRRLGEDDNWGSDWQRVLPGGKPVDPGQDAVLVLKSDARYSSTGDPKTMLEHESFRDTTVRVFVRLGSSTWVQMIDTPVERRIGSRSVQVMP